MASGSGEQGYWPGFVDALSNMVMTLIIIIVLLNIALVFFFFKATKSATRSAQAAVEQVQKSSNEHIDSLQLENQRLKEELKKIQEGQKDTFAPTGNRAGMSERAAAAVAAEQDKEAARAAAGLGQSSVEQAQKDNLAQIASLQLENQRLKDELKKIQDGQKDASTASLQLENQRLKDELKKIQEGQKDASTASLQLENQRLKEELKKIQEGQKDTFASTGNKAGMSERAAAAAAANAEQGKEVLKEILAKDAVGSSGERAAKDQDGQSLSVSRPGAQDHAQDAVQKKTDQLAASADSNKDFLNQNAGTTIENRIEQEELPSIGTGNNVLTSKGDLYIIEYKDERVEFSTETLKDLNKNFGDLISKDKNIKLDIQVEFLNSSKYSYTRRVAYYRASSIRNFLLTKGFDPQKISLRLIEASASTHYPRALIRVAR